MYCSLCSVFATFPGTEAPFLYLQLYIGLGFAELRMAVYVSISMFFKKTSMKVKMLSGVGY